MRPLLWLAPLGAVLLLAGCHTGRQGPPVTETRTVDLGDATSARVEIEMGAGELRIEPGLKHLLSGVFRLPGPEWKPDLRYDISNARGFLSVRQPALRLSGNMGDNRWDLQIAEKVPMDMRVKLGAGQSNLKLGGLALRRLEVDLGAGELDLDLTGNWTEDLEARIRGGVGEATVRFPATVGVRVKASGGIGEISVKNLRTYEGYYVNSAYGRSETQVRVEVTGGIGQINLIGSE